jgi:predicted ester cyclase
MSTEENKAIARRWIVESWQGNPSLYEEVLAPNCIFHGIGGPQDMKAIMDQGREAFPDLTVTVEEMIAEGDKVVTRWTVHGTHTGNFVTPQGPIPPTGKHVTYTGITINRFADGKIVEDRFEGDVLGLLQQIGALPTPAS